MKNRIQEGSILLVAAPYDRSSGQAMLVGSIFAVAISDVVSGSNVEAYVEGVFDITKASGAITQGAKVYWDNTAKNLTTTSSGNTLVGYATQAQQSSDATCRIRLCNPA